MTNAGEWSGMLGDARAPTVSVVIPAFNAAGTLDAALDSVFSQTFEPFEVIVVDDGSSDATADVASARAGRVQLIRQPNSGPGAARNAGLRASRGELVAFLDADDLWLPEKLAAQVAYFDTYPETGLLHTAALKGESADVGVDTPAKDLPLAPPRWVFCELFHTDLDINTLTVMAPRALLDEVGGFDERRHVHVEDWELWLRLAAIAQVGYLPWPTAVRRPGGGMSAAFEKTLAAQAAIIRQLASGACAAACLRHRESPRGCLNRRWHRLYFELGYARMQEGRRLHAAAAFLRAARHQPTDRRTYLQLAALLAGRRIRERLRARRARSRRAGMAQAPSPSVRSLVHDTLYWRARHAVVHRLHDLDDLAHRARSGDRMRVLFDAASPMSFAIFQPVYEQLRLDPRFDFWFTATGGAWDARRLFERVGIVSHVVLPDSVALMKVDACINTDFWDMTWLHRRTRRLHLFHGVAGKYGLDAPVEVAPTIAIFDRLMFPNADRFERYVEAGLVQAGGPVGLLIGYPKVDRLVNGSLDREQIAARLGLDRRRPTVIFAPTWSPDSSLNTIGEALIRELAGCGCNVLVKIHDRSYDPSPRGSGGIDWAARLSVLGELPAVRVVTEADATPFLAVADAMVTDHSSIGFEFALLDRPLVVVDCPSLIARARVTPSKVRALRAAAEVASTPAEVAAALHRQLGEPSLHSKERQALADQFFYRPGTATGRAVAAVYEVLGLDPPARTSAADRFPAAAVGIG